jgi:anti-sigma factor RsiW
MIDPSPDCSEVSVQDRVASSTAEVSSPSVELSHHDVRAQLSDYLDGTLGTAACRAVELHLANCRECRAFRDTLRQTVHALDTLPAHRAPDVIKRRILDRARSGPTRVSS